jgi:serine phosphatase RsbU (regulator of sigma subunit)
MHELWSSASYEPHLLSLPFAYAPAAMLVVITYAIVMRGAPVLRTWFLLHSISLLPYAITLTVSPSILTRGAATEWFRIGASCIPMAAACGSGFQLALLGRAARTRVLSWVMIAVAAAWIVVGSSTHLVIDDVRWLPAGLWFGNAGPWAWATLLTTVVMSGFGFIPLMQAAFRMPPGHERRQIRQTLIANSLTYAGLIDVTLGYGHGVFPVGWILVGTGSLLVVRALVVEDLLRVRAVDTSAPKLVMHFAGAVLLGWVTLTLLGPTTPWWMAALNLSLCYASVRVIYSVVGLVNRGARGGEGPLDRLLTQLITRARPMRSGTEVAQLAIDVIELGLGVRPDVFLASADDWGWSTATGERLDDANAPDPLLGSWLLEQRGAIFADELELRVPEDLRGLLAPLFALHEARALVAVANHDELLAMIAVPATGPRLRGRALWFLERSGERLGEALLHARLARRAAEHAEVAREVELAATVQAELLPPQALQTIGDLALIGSWQPASRCAGDFWGVYPLGDGRVLVAIGDVTGHGVASAMVTAAACGALDVAVRHDREKVELGALMSALDSVVRRIGGGELAMTCAAAIVDPKAREIRFVSCGHAAPYLCRAKPQVPGPAAIDDSVPGSMIELHALVARGNPLGSGTPERPKIVQRTLQPGDVLVWYTDGVIEANDPAGEAFGDRRLQRLLRRVDRAHLTPLAVHDLVHASVAAHRAGRPLADDETLVVAQLGSL